MLNRHTWTLLGVLLLAPDSFAQDTFEENDSCSAAVSIPLGETLGLSVQQVDADWYERVLAPGESIQVKVFASAVSGGEGLFVTAESPCGATVETIDRSDSLQDRILVGNPSNQPRTVTFGALVRGGQPDVSSYRLRVNVIPPPPCFGGPADAYEPNDDCANATPLAIGQSVFAVTEILNDDWYSVVVPAGNQFSVALSAPGTGSDLSFELYGEDCDHFVTGPPTFGGSPHFYVLDAINASGTAKTYHVRVAIKGERGVCFPYELGAGTEPAVGSCIPLMEDSLEPDNAGASATLVTSNPAQFTNLTVAKFDHDLFRVNVGPGQLVRASLQTPAATLPITELTVWADNSPVTRDLEDLLDEGSTTVGAAESLWRNEGATARDVFVRVGVSTEYVPLCNGDGSYDLQIVVEDDPCNLLDDSYAPNQSCGAPALLTSFPLHEGALSARPAQPDFFAVDLAPGEALDFVMLYDRNFGFMNVAEFDGCTMLSVQSADTGVRQFTRKNDTSQVQRWTYRIGAVQPCQSYELFVDLYFGDAGNPASLCFGNGPSAFCPCGNNSLNGSGAGCLHPGGFGAQLSYVGGTSQQNDSLTFRLISASPNSFGILVSGQNLLPASAPGTGLPTAGSGLRCVGGDFRRHGSLMTSSAGDSIGTWGPGLLTSIGMTPGMTRTFQAFYREPPVAGCASGINTTQAVRVTALP